MAFTKLEPASYDKDGDIIDGYTTNQRVAGYLEQISESLDQLVQLLRDDDDGIDQLYRSMITNTHPPMEKPKTGNPWV